MGKVEGQCWDCYDHANFQYFGQTKEYNPKQVQEDYVSHLKAPSTTIECVACGRTLEYTKQDEKWNTKLCKSQVWH